MDAVDVSAGGTFTGNTCDGEPFDACTSGAKTTWFKVEVPAGGKHHYVTSDGFSLNERIGGACTSATNVCVADGDLSASYREAQTVYLFVQSTTGTCGPFTLVVL
jgi:hypothetical protein